MRFLQSMPMRAAAGCAAFAALLLSAAPACAAGTVVIRQSNAQVNTYKNVSIKVVHGALFLTSPDGKGTLVIHRAACSYQGKLLVCAPTAASLVQRGEMGPINIRRGTVYLNDTDDAQPLPLSSAKVPPHSLILAMTTKEDTFISLNGKIDKVVR